MNMNPKTMLEISLEREAPRKKLLGKWLLSGSLTMVYGPTGCGKSTVTSGIVHAIASGGSFLLPEWHPDQPKKVLYLDSEMGEKRICNKLIQVDQANAISVQPENISIFSIESMGGSPWNLSDPENQKAVNSMLKGTDVLVVDNLFGFCKSTQKGDNEFTAWQRFEPWLLKLRKSGRAVILVHHTSKAGTQYGTTAKPALMDNVIRLEPAFGENPNGIAFNLHFEKCRDAYGQDVRPLRASYIDNDGQQEWGVEALIDYQTRKVHEYKKTGLTEFDICQSLGISRPQLRALLTPQTAMIFGDKHDPSARYN